MRVWEWIKDYGQTGANVLGAIILAYVGLSPSPSPWDEGVWGFISSLPGIMFLVGAVLILLGNVFGTLCTRALRLQRKKTEKLENIAELVPAQYYDMCSHELAKILRGTFGYGDTERISVYRHRGSQGKGAFQIIGRYSENPKFAVLGRRLYPDDEGVIGRAWEHRTAVADLPNPENKPELYYQALERDWNISRNTAENFTMKSRSLVACALYESKGVDRVAIVVVESTRMGILEREKVAQAIKGQDGERIYMFLEKMQALEPNLEYPMEEGF